MTHHFIDLKSKTFGRLKVIKRAENGLYDKTRWECKCKCGKEKIVNGCDLRNGRTKSCGCLQKEIVSKLRFKNLKNKRFGRLKVISRSENKHNQVMWKCKCDCGKIRFVATKSLVHNETKSCGCFHRDKVSKQPYYHLYSRIQRRSEKDRMGDILSFKDFLSFTETKKCHYCQEKVNWLEHRNPDGTHQYNLDRKNNDAGYTKENCVVCCPRCNQMKRSLSYDEFYKFTQPIRLFKNKLERVNYDWR